MDEKNDLTGIVRAACGERDGRKVLACKRAFALAEERGVGLLEIAEVCNRDGIKIVACQLGCFK